MEQNDISSRIVFADRVKVNVEKGVEFAPKFDQNASGRREYETRRFPESVAFLRRETAQEAANGW